MKVISGSVGQGGANRKADVLTVQMMINAHLHKITPTPRLVEDGLNGRNTIAAITAYQRRVLGVPIPDGRVDPNGRTLQALNGPANSAAPGGDTGFSYLGGDFGSTSTPIKSTVVYKSDLADWRRIVHDYSFAVIEMVMQNAGVKTGVITSTIRSLDIQIDTMYTYCSKSWTNNQDVLEQYELYGSTGDEIIKVFEANRTKPEAECKRAMKARGEELALQGRRISRHICSPTEYAARNIIDIGMGSTAAASPATYNAGAITNAIKKAVADGYIAKFVDETNISNQCWHLEIIPYAVPLEFKWPA
ncbi:MAG: peptidoglycan-binding domain-containing protein [Marivita sp.]|uniref:peptidoglycan-binding domain-containing protein n=1 Tax=Marivita sp. TaxID=2003365 RepID=UPI003EF9B192